METTSIILEGKDLEDFRKFAKDKLDRSLSYLMREATRKFIENYKPISDKRGK